MTDTTQQFEYPTTARRAFVNLAEAIRTIDTVNSSRRILEAVAGLHVTDGVRIALAAVYAENSADDREALAREMSLVLQGQEKFDGARFVYHATSDSTADDDSEEGKWSFNRTHQAEAQKTTIEADSGEVVEL